jgi:threonine synthase
LHGRIASSRSSRLADGRRIKDPPRKDEILKAIRETGGDVFMVSDEEIAPAMKELYRMGIMAEPTSATVYAAFRKNENELKGRVLMPITGTGMKNTDSLAAVFGKIGLSHR